MFRRVSISLHIIALFLVACLLLLPSVSPALAASDDKPQKSDNQNQPITVQVPVTRYLALGDSLAYGFQPNDDHTHGYVDDLFTTLQNWGVTDHLNLGCPRETTSTFISGGECSYPLHSQLATALAYLQQASAGHATLVTLDIGANNVLGNMTIDIQNKSCIVDGNKFNTDLQTLDQHLTQTILPQLHASLIDQNGQSIGNLALLNYYDPFQNACPNTLPLIQTLNTHLAQDVQGFGTLVDILSAFGGVATPNRNLCNYTWTCSAPPLGPDIHPTTTGYQVMSRAIESQNLQNVFQTVNVPSGDCGNGKNCKGSNGSKND
jgi:lysophospholipase L1-like esterase